MENLRKALKNIEQLSNAYRALDKSIVDSFYNINDFMKKNKEEIIKNIEKERRNNGIKLN